MAVGSTFDIYTDRSFWEAALSGSTIVEDGFDTPIASAQSITFDSGVVSQGSAPPPSAAVNAVNLGVYGSNNDPDGSGGFQSTTWIFPDPIFAFGMYFIDSASNFGITVSGDFGGTGILSFDTETELGGLGTGFLGIIGAGLFDEIVFTPTPNAFSQNEGYAIDDLAFASPAEVPVPATIWLSLAGLGMLGAMWRRRSSTG